MPATAEAFICDLTNRGFDFFAGVPCSLIKDLLGYLEARKDLAYLPATREDSALGAAAGAYLAGRRPVVLMQGSGLGLSINALASLHQIYGLPCLLLITWRGFGGLDAPEHIVLGPALPALLESLGISWRVLEPAQDHSQALDWADATLLETLQPVVLLVKKGAI